MKLIKQTGRFLCSMKFAMILLIILVAVCTAGSLIPQGEVMSYYTTGYSETVAGAILLFGLDDIFHCGWFIVLTLFLCLNLLLCNVLHFPKLIRRMKEGYTLEKCLKSWDKKPVAVVSDVDAVFEKMGMRKAEKSVLTTEGQVQGSVDAGAGKQKNAGSVKREYRYASRNKIGIWGAWLCHFGMLIIIAGFGLGQMMKTEYTVYGVPGQTKTVGDLNYELTIDDFEILLREDETVEQYIADITVTDTVSGESQSGSTWVNKPISMFGLKFYQNSTGWAGNVSIWKGDELIQEELLCAGEYLSTEGKEELKLMLRAFYPDHYEDEMGNQMTLSSALNNPAYLYALYYNDQVLGMNVIGDGEKITVDEYTYVFHDPQPYTLIQVKRDPFTGVAAVGGLLMVIALILAFYVRPEELWAVQQEDGTWAVAGKSRKGGTMYEEKLADVCAELSGKKT